jgi:hypothetical protein
MSHNEGYNPDNYDSMAYRDPKNWNANTTDCRQLDSYSYRSPYHHGVTQTLSPRQYGTLMGVIKGGSRRRTVHRKHKSYRKSKRVRHTRRKQTRRHRHRR